MEFETDKVEYSLRDFITCFKSKLPVFVLVSRGFFGDSLIETLDKGQIIRIERVVTQKRVIADVVYGCELLNGKSLSIPINTLQQFTLEDSSDSGFRGTLDDLLKYRRPPFKVTCEGNINIQGLTLPYMQNSGILIRETYDDMYILGNFISFDQLHLPVQSIPLYLKDVGVLLITGARDRGQDVWQAFQKSLTRIIAKNVDFDIVDPNPEVSVYDKNENATETKHSTATEYCTIGVISGEDHPYGSLTLQEETGSQYEKEFCEIIPAEYSVIENANTQRYSSIVSKGKHEELPQTTHFGISKECLVSASLESLDLPSDSVTSERDFIKEKKSKTSVSLNVEILRSELTRTSGPFVDTNEDDSESSDQVIIPLDKSAVKKHSESSETNKAETRLRRQRDSKNMVVDMSVEEVGRILETLGLSSYIKLFADESIDGAILKVLDEDILCGEFNMNESEANKLMCLARKGHIPSELCVLKFVDISIGAMEFETDRTDYSLKDFIKCFKAKLPIYVQVSQGFLGDKSMETLDREQVIRMEKVVTQKRVVAEVVYGCKRLMGKSLSIPVDHPKEFEIVSTKERTISKTGLHGSLEHLLRKTKPPFKVTCEGDTFSSASTVPAMQSVCLVINETYEDVYLLGNLVSDGRLFLSVRSIPQHLQDVRVSIIQGIKTLSEKVWQTFQDNMTKVIVEGVDFNRVNPNPEISVYEKRKNASDLKYSTPSEYCTIEMIYEGHQYGSLTSEKVTLPHDIANVYDIIPADYGVMGKVIKPHVTSKPLSRTQKELPPTPPVEEDARLESPPLLPTRPNRNNRNDYPRSTEKLSVTTRGDALSEGQTKAAAARPLLPNTLQSPKEVQMPVEKAKGNVSFPTDLSIEEVGKALKKLHLSSYVKQFANAGIDGAILHKFSEDILCQEFKMKRFEAIKVMCFARDGHIPK